MEDTRRHRAIRFILCVAPLLVASACFGQSASVLVESNVENATVLVDGQRRGRTDANGAAFIDSLPAGSHRFHLRKSGYRDTSVTVRLDAGLTNTVALELEEFLPPGGGALLVETTPHNALILLDGQQLGRTGSDGRAYFPDIAPGSHRLKIQKQGFEPATRRISLDAGLDRTLQVHLQRTTPAPSAEGRDRPSSPSVEERSSRSFGGVWGLLLSAAAGIVAGLLAGWLIQRERVQYIAEDRDYWESKFREEQARNYRSAVGIRFQPGTATDSAEATEDAATVRRTVEQLRNAYEGLRAENQELRRRLEEVEPSAQQRRRDEDDPASGTPPSSTE